MKLSEIRVNPKNPRAIKKEALRKLMNSIRDFPGMMELRPMVVNKEGIILGGNMRFRALGELGYTEIPDTWVKRADQLTPEEEKRFIIEDNVQFGEWDFNMLSREWDLTLLNEWGVEFPPDFETERAKDDDFIMPEIVETDIVPGDLFRIGPHRLLCGDSTKAEDVQKVMDDNKFNLLVTDPPYNVNYSSKNAFLNLIDKGNRIQTDIINDNEIDRGKYNEWIKLFLNTIKPYAADYNAAYVFGIAESLIGVYELKDFHISNMLVWVKNRLVLGRQDYKGKHENIIYGWWNHHKWYGDFSQVTVFDDNTDFTKLKKEELLKIVLEIFSDKIKTSVIRCDTPLSSELHPTMKPILLLAELIKNSSTMDQIVFDGFLGSGSTMVAAHQLRRKCYGIEISPQYCQVILDRMRKLDDNLKIEKT